MKNWQKIGFSIDQLGQSERPVGRSLGEGRGSIVYGREGQRVEREIFVFKKSI